jgi:hypothetical protein
MMWAVKNAENPVADAMDKSICRAITTGVSPTARHPIMAVLRSRSDSPYPEINRGFISVVATDAKIRTSKIPLSRLRTSSLDFNLKLALCSDGIF